MTHSVQAYATILANNLTKITMEKFYPNQDVSFMEYFLELTQREGEFVVPHKKLIEYGIMTSTQSGDVKKKLNQLNLEKDEDYRLGDVSEPVKQGGFVIHKVYHLTPEAFKKCLLRAQRRANQEVDPVVYVDYYLLLEKVFKLYIDYECQYAYFFDLDIFSKIDFFNINTTDAYKQTD